jgi:hypothetical protein
MTRKSIDWTKYAASGSEDAEQTAVFGWAAENVGTIPELKFMFAIPNGMYTPNKRVAAQMRAMGMKKGVSDILWPIRRGIYSGLFIEMKRQETATQRAGKIEDNQSEFGKFVQSQGYGFAICYGFEQARDMILEYYKYDNPVVITPEKTVIRKISEKDMETFNIEDWK